MVGLMLKPAPSKSNSSPVQDSMVLVTLVATSREVALVFWVVLMVLAKSVRFWLRACSRLM